MAIEDLGPITGTFPKEPMSDKDLLELPAHVGFDQAWRDAIAQAEKAWHSPDQDRVEIPVTIEYEARIDIWNPGGIGQYNVKITPHG